MKTLFFFVEAPPAVWNEATGFVSYEWRRSGRKHDMDVAGACGRGKSDDGLTRLSAVMKLSKVTCWVIAFGSAILFVLFEYAFLVNGISFPPVLICGFGLPLIILPPLIYSILRTFSRGSG